MFGLADRVATSGCRVVTTMTRRVFVGQMNHTPARSLREDEGTLIAELPSALSPSSCNRGPEVIVQQDKVQGVSPDFWDHIAAQSAVDAMIVEAAGPRRLPLKAPAPHEPVNPTRQGVHPHGGLDVLGSRWTPSTSTAAARG